MGMELATRKASADTLRTLNADFRLIQGID
jgi:hypothetical protein